MTVGGHTYRTTIAPMGGAYWIPLAAEHRKAAGVTAGEEVTVVVEPDTAPREVDVPSDLAAALGAVRTIFDALAFSHRKEWVRWVTEAKKPETRAARVLTTVESVAAGKNTR